MGMTIVEKILARASGQAKVSPGDLAVVEVDSVLMLDTNFLAVQRREVGGIVAAVGQAHVQVAGLLAERKVLLAVHGEGEDGVVVPKDGRRAIALVHIEVDDRHPKWLSRMCSGPFGLHQPSGDRGVIEDTKATALIGIRMVGAPSQIARHPFDHGGSCRLDGGAG